MLKSISKKVGAVVLSAAMALSLAAVAPVSADAATAYTMTNKAGQEVEIGAASTYYVKGVKATQYVKVVPRGEAKSGITVKHQGKLIKATQKVKGTKNGTFGIVTTADESVAGKKYNVWVYIYNSKTATKPVKTLKGGAVTVKENKLEMTGLEATGAKELTVKFNKDAAELKAADFVVKKEAAKPTVENVAVTADKAVITLASKMTEGTYSVTVAGKTLEVTVKDEALASYQLADKNLIATSTNTAVVYYYALNQYGEKISDSNADTNVSTSFGTAEVSVAPGKANGFRGTIEVTNITNAALKVPGTVGTIVLVNKNSGVSLTDSVTYAAAATPSSVEVLGVYNTTKNKYADIVAGSPDGYVVAVEFKDQYNNVLKQAELGDLNITQAVGTGGLTVSSNVTTIDIDDKAVTVLTITGAPKAGTSYYTIVNSKKGLLLNGTVDVQPATVIKSLSIAAKDTLYSGTKQEFDYTITDDAGNLVTDYKTITAATSDIKITGAGKFVWEKQKDGSAKLFYTPSANSLTDKQSTIDTIQITANPITSGKYFVQTQNLKVYAAKKATKVVGITGLEKAVATGNTYTIKAKNVKVEDQYSNALDYTGNLYVSVNGAQKTYSDGKCEFSIDTVGSYDVVIALKSADATNDQLAYTYKLTVLDASKEATNLTVKSVKDGAQVKVASGATSLELAKTDIEITGTVNGKTVLIPSANYSITDDAIAKVPADKTITEKKTIEIAVETTENGQSKTVVLTADVTYSNATQVVTTLKDDATVEEVAVANDNTVAIADLAKAFEIKDQYGESFAGGVKYDVTVLSGTATSITKNGTASATVVYSGTEIKLSVTATFGDMSVTKTVTFKN